LEAQNLVFGITRKSLEATVLHACPHCEAPGVFKNDPRTRDNWPGCYDEKRRDQPVGDVCPNCGKHRRANLSLGELSASMPLWLWNGILALKWCVVKVLSLKT
jgi:ssDNA-binding Zn-finger/Zn-ribbon topoisomerase 1